jgi:hypothetical protein
MTIATMSAWCFHLSPDRKLSVIDRIASTATETATDRKQPLVKSSLESGKLFGLWCREGADCRFVLILNKLLKCWSGEG